MALLAKKGMPHWGQQWLERCYRSEPFRNKLLFTEKIPTYKIVKALLTLEKG